MKSSDPSIEPCGHHMISSIANEAIKTNSSFLKEILN